MEKISMCNSGKEIFNLLKDLKENHNIFGLKAEFETEGATYEEVAYLKNLANDLELDLTLKIGGCEAVRDLQDAKSLGANTIIAPMIESSYAAKKYIDAINRNFSKNEQQNIKFLINIETIQGLKCLDEIFNSEFSNSINGIVFGRTDMLGSLQLPSKDVNDDILFNYAETIAEITKKYNKEFIIGGGISPSSISFFKKISKTHLNKVETRKIVFEAKKLLNSTNIEENIIKAIEFELLWLKNKENLFKKTNQADKKRIEILEKRYKNLMSSI